MKKILTVSLLLLLALTLLWGCGEKTDATGDQAAVPYYYFLDRETVLAPDANGVYTLNFVVDGEKKTFKCADQAMVDALFYQDFVGLTLEGENITGFTRMSDMAYTRVAQDYFVQSMGGNKVKLSGPENYELLDMLIDVPDGTPIYNVTPQSTDYSGNATLQKSDCFSAVADMEGNVIAGYITARPAATREGKLYCQHCEKEVEFLDWIATNKLPTSAGHYILAQDITMAKTTIAAAGAVCLDLNGKIITQNGFGERIYRIGGSAEVSIMDSVGTGKIVPNSTDGSSSVTSGLGIYVNGAEAIFNLHSGTIDATECSASFGNAIYMNDGTINIYGGTVLGGNSFGAGGCAISAKGILNIYGGKIVGGKLFDAQYYLPIGGAAIRVLGICTIFGGEIIGGETDTNGGAIRVCGDAFGGAKLVLKGGSITGGKAPVGGGIYVSVESELQIVGDVEVTGNEVGNIYLDSGSVASVDIMGMSGNAPIGVTLADGATIRAEESANLSQYITSENGKNLSYLGDGKWGEK